MTTDHAACTLGRVRCDTSFRCRATQALPCCPIDRYDRFVSSSAPCRRAPGVAHVVGLGAGRAEVALAGAKQEVAGRIMAESTPVAQGRIFISYRREETAYPAGWLFDRLAHHFDGGQVFKDVDSIQPGDDFVEVIATAVGSCHVLLALIGAEWLTITDEHGQRRLDNPDDFVRLEIEAALTRGVRVIPILLDGARMPRADELPASLAKLVRRQALELSPARFDFDTSRLLRVLDRTLAEVQGPPAAGDPTALRVESWPMSQSQESGSMGPPLERPRAAEPGSPTSAAPAQGQPDPDGGVSFTAGYPRVVAPQLRYSLSVYVHLGRLQAAVDQYIADESQRFGLRPAVSRVAAFVPLPGGTRLWVRPEVPGVGFDPPAQELRWLKDLQRITFRLQALSHTAGRSVRGAVEVHAGPLLVAQVPLSIRVRGVGERQEGAEGVAASTARLFRSVFASYAPEDDDIVKAVADAYRPLGIDMLLDKVSMQAGEDRHQGLSQLIEEADVFQLFWSKAASRSHQVAEEWQHALSLQDRKGERFIRPVYWNFPWPRPPAELKHLHFAPFDPALLSGVAGR
jgi:hypothetical protein